MKTTKLVAALAALMTVATASLFAQEKPYVGTFIDMDYWNERNTKSSSDFALNADGSAKPDGVKYGDKDWVCSYAVDEAGKKVNVRQHVAGTKESSDEIETYQYSDSGLWLWGDDTLYIRSSAKFKAEDAAFIAGKSFSVEGTTLTFTSDGKLTIDGSDFGIYFVDKGAKMILIIEEHAAYATYETDKKGKVTLHYYNDVGDEDFMTVKEQGKAGKLLNKLTK